MNEPIHACHNSSQPYVTILCTKQEHYVYAQPEGLPAGVYRADWSKTTPVSAKTPLYTFNDNDVSCPECLTLIEQEPST